jgi:hypothetical protein
MDGYGQQLEGHAMDSSRRRHVHCVDSRTRHPTTFSLFASPAGRYGSACWASQTSSNMLRMWTTHSRIGGWRQGTSYMPTYTSHSTPLFFWSPVRSGRSATDGCSTASHIRAPCF